MASYLLLNALARAQINEYATGQVRIVRTGIIKNLNTNAVPNDEIFAESRSTPGFPAMLSPHPGSRYAAALLRQITIDAQPGNKRKALVTLIYDTNAGFAPIPVTFVLSRRTTMVESATELHPNGLVPMVVWWQNPADPVNDRVRRTAKMRYFTPFQRLLASAWYKNSPPPAQMIGALGTVNDGNWRNLPRGYWFYADQSDVTQDYGGSYTVTLELWSWLTKDWSSWEVLRDDHGRYLHVDPNDVTALKNTPYTVGMINRNGIMKVGMYQASDFTGNFGFGGIA